MIDCTGSSAASVQPLRRSRASSAARTSSARSLTGKIFPRRLDLRGNPLGFDQIDELIGPQGGQGRMEKRPLVAKSLDEAAYIQGVGEIATRPAGHEDFGAGTFFLLQKQRPPSPLGRSAGRHQAGRPPPMTITSQSSMPLLFHKLPDPGRVGIGSAGPNLIYEARLDDSSIFRLHPLTPAPL